MLEKINLNDIKDIALKASVEIMKIYKKDFEVDYKEDNSPLTQADIKSNEIICNSLINLYPNIPIMSEENKQTDYEIRKNWEYYWCIDPIDGTKEFVKKNDEFTVNIALIHNKEPVLGVVYAPAIEVMYSAKKGVGAFKNGQKLPIKRDDNKYIIVASKSHMSDETQAYIDNINTTKEKEMISMGSSLKLCLVADGSADCYPRIAPTMEWDTAAADAVVRCVGKMTYEFEEEKPLIYNKKDLSNPNFVVK